MLHIVGVKCQKVSVGPKSQTNEQSDEHPPPSDRHNLHFFFFNFFASIKSKATVSDSSTWTFLLLLLLLLVTWRLSSTKARAYLRGISDPSKLELAKKTTFPVGVAAPYHLPWSHISTPHIFALNWVPHQTIGRVMILSVIYVINKTASAIINVSSRLAKIFHSRTTKGR